MHVEVLEHGAWAAVRPTGGAPYELPTREDCERFARTFYPDSLRFTEKKDETPCT